MTINNPALTMIGSYNLEISQEDNNTTIFKIILKEGNKIIFKENKNESILIIDDKNVLTQEYTKRGGIYYNQIRYYELDYNMIRPTYAIKFNIYLNNNHICYVPTLFNYISVIRVMLYDNVSEKDIEISKLYDKEIKRLNLISINERHYIENYIKKSYNYDNDCKEFSTEIKKLIRILKLNLKSEYNYIIIEPSIIKYIKINDLYCKDDKWIIKMSIDLSQVRHKNIFYYNLLIVYCLIKLEEDEFIYWLLEYMDNYQLCEDLDPREDYCINSCELIL